MQYINSLRLRTLPLSISGVILGSFIMGNVDVFLFVLTLLTVVSLQILSNLTNELGDWQKGIDDEDRQGKIYGLQQGAVTEIGIKSCIGIFGFLAVILGVLVVRRAFGTLFLRDALIFLAFGVAAIIAAVTYTLGRHAYGYKGMGDIMVFLFFGILSVCGSYYLQTLHWEWRVLLPATAIGCLSVAVLNLNNIRDMEQDRRSGKTTIAQKLGYRNACYYQAVLFAAALTSFCLYGYYISLVITPILVLHIIKLFKAQKYSCGGNPREKSDGGSGKLPEGDLDNLLPVLTLTTLGVSILVLLV